MENKLKKQIEEFEKSLNYSQSQNEQALYKKI